VPTRKNVTRWKWASPVGYKDKGRDYDYLILMGATSYGYQYFLIPFSEVKSVCTSGASIGSNVQANTDKKRVSNKGTGKIIWSFEVSEKELVAFFKKRMIAHFETQGIVIADYTAKAVHHY
jgi:hypothetical protein